MRGRERLQAVCEGASPGFQPVLAEYGLNSELPDGLIVTRAEDLAAARSRHPDAAVFLAVPNAFARAGNEIVELLRLSEQDPGQADERLSGFAEQTLSQIEAAKRLGADGVFYVLSGADPARSTPMQYGGLFLELDREALAKACEMGMSFLYLDAAKGAYLDFVADLPASAFGWDRAGTGIEVAAVREIRPGALFADDPEADILLKPPSSQSAVAPRSDSREGAYA